MLFLTNTDVLKLITQDILDQITDGDNSLLDVAESSAITRMKSYLNSRYDVAAIFSATGTSRNALILEMLTDLVIYTIHARVTPHSVPEERARRYDDVIRWLKEVSRGELNVPDAPLLVDTNGNAESLLKFGNSDNPKYKW
jgi:phage gp36-like protein